MWAFAKALLLVGRYLRRISLALESIAELYELELRAGGVFRVKPGLGRDEAAVEIAYGARPSAEGEPNPEWE